MKIRNFKEFIYENKRVLLRLDINSPIDPKTKKIVNENRIEKSLPTLKYLLDHKAKVAIIAHQGDTLDYQNLISLEEHAQKLSEKLKIKVEYIDDVCGPAAKEKVKSLKAGEVILLGNLRYLTEEVSTFENVVKLTPKEMLNTYLVRNLAPLFDFYINEAFAAAHRNAPSMVAFQELLPSAAGDLFFKEVEALNRVMQNPQRPCVFILGGAKISDAFGMMKQVLENGSADKILAGGVTGNVMLVAAGYDIGKGNMKFLKDRSLDAFIQPAKEYLEKYSNKILYPIDLAYENNGKREEIAIQKLPIDVSTMDIGRKTVEKYKNVIANAGTIFMNGPAGVYENALFEYGTKEIAQALAQSKGYSLIGGGDTVTAIGKYINLKDIDYICTAGGAMVRYLSGVKLPLIEAMENHGK
ncbi:phosphoglycerate kinase [Garciella nitratireducens]|uniref:Phosphoglycerate kinase n=1 Tax=Garciella nitratireducens DSM 15102 TaxID=1121911 RepID=A0A1T4LP23_9FIRM|nr:phosphoglycerate kinase [Garciella nitratireducens]SJZ56214.1 phosphoglycerate kinase [Garciella nitratireducens DSM 15102]